MQKRGANSSYSSVISAIFMLEHEKQNFFRFCKSYATKKSRFGSFRSVKLTFFAYFFLFKKHDFELKLFQLVLFEMKKYNASVFQMKKIHRIRFRIKSFSCCQALIKKIHNVYDFVSKNLQLPKSQFLI